MKNILTFLAGVTIGVGVSWVYHKNKYEQMVQDEVESLRDHMKEKEYHDKSINDPDKEERTQTAEEMEKENYEEIEEVDEIITKQNYNTAFNKEESITDKYKKPYVITPDDFANIPGFDTDTFYYHHDDIISNDNQEIVDDVEYILGLTIEEIREQFGIYEDDAVYIRNMRLKTDYEILLEETNYTRRNGD